MGYYKQQEIAGQDYVGESTPRPRPASSHVSLAVRRRDMRQRKPQTPFVTFAIMAGMFVLGVVLGVVI
jgi:hypothetical protein